MSECVFCDILSEAAEASFVHRGNSVSAFMDISPVTTGHLLVVPNLHAAYLAEVDEAVAARMFTVGVRLAAALRRSLLRPEGTNLFLADGKAAGQDVFHVHLHVIPRYAGDGFRVESRGGRESPPSREELDEIASLIRRTA